MLNNKIVQTWHIVKSHHLMMTASLYSGSSLRRTQPSTCNIIIISIRRT